MLSVKLSGLNTDPPHKKLVRKKKYRKLTVLIDGPELYKAALFSAYIHQTKRSLQGFQDICDNQVLPRVTIIVPKKPEFYIF